MQTSHALALVSLVAFAIFAAALVAAGILALAAVVVFFVAGAMSRPLTFMGLAQRAIYVGIVLWQAAALIPLAR